VKLTLRNRGIPEVDNGINVILVEKGAYLWNATNCCLLEGSLQTSPGISRKKEYMSIGGCQKSRNSKEHRKLKKCQDQDTAGLKGFQDEREPLLGNPQRKGLDISILSRNI
jgi:hypothetical protein